MPMVPPVYINKIEGAVSVMSLLLLIRFVCKGSASQEKCKIKASETHFYFHVRGVACLVCRHERRRKTAGSAEDFRKRRAGFRFFQNQLPFLMPHVTAFAGRGKSGEPRRPVVRSVEDAGPFHLINLKTANVFQWKFVLHSAKALLCKRFPLESNHEIKISRR